MIRGAGSSRDGMFDETQGREKRVETYGCETSRREEGIRTVGRKSCFVKAFGGSKTV